MGVQIVRPRSHETWDAPTKNQKWANRPASPTAARRGGCCRCCSPPCRCRGASAPRRRSRPPPPNFQTRTRSWPPPPTRPRRRRRFRSAPSSRSAHPPLALSRTTRRLPRSQPTPQPGGCLHLLRFTRGSRFLSTLLRRRSTWLRTRSRPPRRRLLRRPTGPRAGRCRARPMEDAPGRS